MSKLNSIAVGTIILLVATNAHAWDQQKPPTTELTYSGSVGAVNGFSSNVGKGIEATGAQSATSSHATVTPNSSVTGTAQEGTSFSFGLNHGAGSSSFTASSYSFGKEFRGY